MSDPISYPDVDPMVVKLIKSLPKLDQVQYSSKDQLLFLIDIAVKLGLYDAVNILKRLIGQL